MKLIFMRALPPLLIWFSLLFLFFDRNTYFSKNSIPGVLFILLCLANWQWVSSQLVKYRKEGLLIGVALFIGLVFSHRPNKSVDGVYDFVRGLLMFFPGIYIAQNYSRRFLSLVPWVATLAIIFLGAVLSFNSSGTFLELNMLRPSKVDLVGHFNFYSSTAAVLCLAGLVCLIYKDQISRTGFVLSLLTFLGGLLIVVYSGSRGSALTLFVVASCVVFLKLPKWRKQIATISMLGMVLFCFLLFTNQFGNFMSSWNRGGNDITNGRLKIYEMTLTSTLENAPLTGFGPTTFKYFNFTQVLGSSSLSFPHSVYLESFFSLGFLGSMFLFCGIGSLFLRLKNHNFEKFNYVFGCTILFFYLLRGFLDLQLFSTSYAGAISLAFGLMLGCSKGDSTEERIEV